MSQHPWIKEFPGAVIVSDVNGVLLEMNDKAAKGFAKDGGLDLIGTNMFDCHPEPARTKLMELYKTCRTNAYTIEKNGIKKFIYQTPWYRDGQFAGFIELSLEIPFDLPHFLRD